MQVFEIESVETPSFVGPQLRNTALFESVDGFYFDFYIGVRTAYLEFSIEIHKISERRNPTSYTHKTTKPKPTIYKLEFQSTQCN